ncbi:MAG: hypothetical protein GXO79_10290 [Chlorobi bacterium]|nr:hypothetical protein [Chlorobiota bacterium]
MKKLNGFIKSFCHGYAKRGKVFEKSLVITPTSKDVSKKLASILYLSYPLKKLLSVIDMEHLASRK